MTDPDSRLLPARGGGFIQGCNCQDAAADDRLMLGGCACQDPGDALQAQRLAQAAGKGAAAAAAGHAAHAGDPAAVARCHARLCALPEKGRRGPGHDPAACHAAMTGGIGVFVADAGYHSAANLEAPGPGRLFADAKARDLARREPAAGPARRRHRRGGQRAPAGHPRRPRALQAPRARRRGPARQPQRRRRAAPLLPARPAQRHQRVPVRRPRAQPPSAGLHQPNPRHPGLAALRAARPRHALQHQQNPATAAQRAPHPDRRARARPEPGTGTAHAQPPQKTATAPRAYTTVHYPYFRPAASRRRSPARWPKCWRKACEK